MVFFTCNACGQSIKKNKVEKHYQVECRNCEILSCMDCGKEFAGDEYLSHTSCISEAEKYQGALYSESNKGQPKGEKKQQEWLERIRKSVVSAGTNPRIANLLERIADYPNIPRKKAKFVNFVKNSLNVRDDRTLDQLWEAFDAAAKPTPGGDSQVKQSAVNGNTEDKEHVGSEKESQANVSEGNNENEEPKPSKKQKRKGAEDIKGEGQSSSRNCKPVGSCVQEEGVPPQVASSGGVCNSVEGVDAVEGETTGLSTKMKKKKDKLEEADKAVIDAVEEPNKKKSKKAKGTDNCGQQVSTTELFANSDNSTTKHKKSKSQETAVEECVVTKMNDEKPSKRKRKHKSEAEEESSGALDKGEGRTVAMLNDDLKIAESIEQTAAMNGTVQGPTKKKLKTKGSSKHNECVTEDASSSGDMQCYSQDNGNNEGMVIQESSDQASKKKKKKKTS